jgi:transposase InsO family protein
MTKAQQKRLVNWRLKVLRHERNVTQSISRTCRHFGVSRQWFYKWRARYAAHGEAGLCDQSTVPRRSPRATPREVVSKVLYLRQNYHFGPAKIGDYLRRFHRISLATATVHRILQRHGVARLPGIQFADEVIRRLPFRIYVVQTDNGAEFQSKFHWHLGELGIRHVYIRPRTPRLNGKVKKGVSDDIRLFNAKLREWEDYYNFHRPHGSLGGQTPYERLLEKTKAKRRAKLSPRS